MLPAHGVGQREITPKPSRGTGEAWIQPGKSACQIIDSLSSSETGQTMATPPGKVNLVKEDERKPFIRRGSSQRIGSMV